MLASGRKREMRAGLLKDEWMDGWMDTLMSPRFPTADTEFFSPLWLTEKSCRKVSSRLYLKGAERLVFQNYRELRGSFLWLAGDSESFIYWLPRGPHSSQSVWSGDLKIKHVPRVFVAGCKNSLPPHEGAPIGWYGLRASKGVCAGVRPVNAPPHAEQP